MGSKYSLKVRPYVLCYNDILEDTVSSIVFFIAIGREWYHVVQIRAPDSGIRNIGNAQWIWFMNSRNYGEDNEEAGLKLPEIAFLDT
jgi:hypothetical protein